jgi:predicted DCC family thiol-disulfide oxidoreductase YuxK
MRFPPPVRDNGRVTATFLYDGDCAFCSSCVRFVQRFIPTPATIVPWQFANLDALGVGADDASEAVQWIEPGRPVLAGPAAISRLLRTSPRAAWRPLGALLALRPVTALAWPVYRWVARNRHRLPGGTAACALPPRQV